MSPKKNNPNVRATHPPPILPIDVDNNKVGVIITTSDHDTIPPTREVVGGDVTTTTTITNVTRQKGEEDHDVISPKSVKTVDIIRTNALSEQYGGTNVEEELPPLTPSKEFHDPLGVIQRFLNDPSYHANINITENYFIGHSNMSSSSSHDEQYSFM